MAKDSVKLDEAIMKKIRANLSEKYEGELYGKIGDLVNKAVDEYFELEKIWDCRKRILTNENQEFFKKNSQGNKGIAILKIFPWATVQYISVPATKYYGIKLMFKDANGNEIPDDAIIEFWKENISGGEPIAQHEYREFKKEITPLKNQIKVSSGENLVIYVEEKYAGKIPNIEFRFAVDLCVRR